MTFAFFATAAPASQPVPPPDASAPAAAPGSATSDAFDAALAETLAVIDRHAARQTAGGASELPMAVEWIFPAFSAPVDPAADVEQAARAVPSDDDRATAGQADAPIDMSALPVDMAVGIVVDASSAPAPVVARTEPAIAAAAPSAPAASATARSRETVIGETAAVAPQATARAAASAGAGDVAVAPVTDPRAPEPATASPAPAPITASRAPAIDLAVPASHAPASDVAVPASPAPARDVAVPAASGDTASLVADATAQVAEPSAAAGGSGRPSTTAAMSESQRAALRYVVDAVQQMPPSEAAAPASAPAVSAAVVVATVAGVPVAAAPAADVMAAAPSDRAGIEVAAVAQSESQMGSGEEGQGQGQGRPSPDFVRFAAALSQAGGPDRDDSGRVVTTGTPAPAVQAASATAATAPVAPTTPATMTPGEENIGRLVQAMRVNARPGAWEATVRLNPEHLGDVTIALRVERNMVSAIVNAEAAGVRQWLETQEQAVRSGMAEQGLQLERFVVQRDGQRRDAEQHDAPPRQRRRQPSPAPEGAERFEIHV